MFHASLYLRSIIESHQFTSVRNYNKIIWFYQLSLLCELAAVKSL